MAIMIVVAAVMALVLMKPLRAKLVDGRNYLVEHIGLLTLLGSNAPNEAVHSFDVRGATEQCARGRRGFAEPFGGLRVLLEGNGVFVLGAQRLAELPRPVVDGP